MARKPIPASTESKVLGRSRRRCAFCWGLEYDLGVKRVQIGHIDHDPSNNAEDNLVALCLPHHDEYDTTPQQTKRFTPVEAKQFRDELYDVLKKKQRTVEYGFLESDGRVRASTSDAQRLGVIVDAFDEDVSREQPTGLRLLSLAQHFIQAEGDFAAGREAMKSLLRLIEREGIERVSAAASFLLGRNVAPVASPLVSLARVLCVAEETDAMFSVSLRHLAREWAFYGEGRSFGKLTIQDVPRPQMDAFCACLSGVARGVPVACPERVRRTAAKDLVELVCRATVAYALQRYEFPVKIDAIYYSHLGRVAPGPGFIGSDGPIENYERGRWPPN